MKEYAATDVKGRWGQISDAALREPVAITKHGRPALVVTSAADYEELQQLRFEQLKARVQAGFEQLDRGESSDLTMDDLKAMARQIHDDRQSGNARRTDP